MFKYIGSTLKRFIPFFIISAVILFSLGLIFVASSSSFVTSYKYEGMDIVYQNRPNGGLLFLLIPAFLLTCVAPLIANSYRNSLKSADFYYQTGKGNKSVRFVHNLSILGVLLIIFSGVFFLTYFFLLIKQLPTMNYHWEDEYMIEDGIIFNYLFVFLAYFPSILALIITYFISYLFVTRSNNFVNSLITLVLGHAALGLLIMLPIYVYDPNASNLGWYFIENGSYLGLKSASPLSYLFMINRFFNPLINGSMFNFFIFDNEKSIIEFVLSIISHLAMIGVALYGLVMFIVEKESSGEFAGKAPGRGVLQEIIFHTGYMCLGIGFASLINLTGFQLFSLMYAVATFMVIAAVYFALSGLLRRTFKFKWYEWIIYAGLSQLPLIVSVTGLITSAIAAS